MSSEQSPPTKKRRLITQTPCNDNAQQSTVPQFELQEVDGKFELVLKHNANDIDTNAITNETKVRKRKRKRIDLCSTDNNGNASHSHSHSHSHSDTDTNNSIDCKHTRTAQQQSEYGTSRDDDSQCQTTKRRKFNSDHSNSNTGNMHSADLQSLHGCSFLNKPIMHDAANAIHQFFTRIIEKYKSEPHLLRNIEIEGRIGMLLKKAPSKNRSIRNNRYLRVADDVFAGKNTPNGSKDSIKVFTSKQRGFRFDADVKKQAFYYFLAVMNGLYINAEILTEDEKLDCNKQVWYPSMTRKASKNIIKKYNHNYRDIEYVSNSAQRNNRKQRGQKERIANLDICFNFEHSDYDIRIDAAMERNMDEDDVQQQTNDEQKSETKPNWNEAFHYKRLRCIRCKECVEYTLDGWLQIAMSTTHTYTRNLFDGSLIDTMRQNMMKNDKMPFTKDCKQRQYEIEIEIVDFARFVDVGNINIVNCDAADDESKRLSVSFSNTCLQIAKLLAYLNDFSKTLSEIPELCRYDVKRLDEHKVQNQILPLYKNAYYKNHYYHNVLHKQQVD